MFYLHASTLGTLEALNVNTGYEPSKSCLTDDEPQMTVRKSGRRSPLWTEKLVPSSFFWVLYNVVEEEEFQ